MKIADIINQLRAVLPKYTDYFSSVLPILSITTSGGIATIVTSTAHGLVNGASIVISDVQVETSIAAVTKDGMIFTFMTGEDHDLTLGWPDHRYVDLRDFTDAGWNDSFYVTAVSNRRTFSVRSSQLLPVLNGNEVLLEIRMDGVNGRYSATVIDSTTFTVSGDFSDGNYRGGVISTAQRISGSATEERALEQYTEQGLSALWMFVVPSDARVSKDRSNFSDATSAKATGTDMRLRLIDGFSVIIIKNTSQDIAAIGAIDICRHDLLLPILKSINGIRFSTGLTYDGDFRTILIGHNFVDYNRAYLVYRYEFEVAMDLTNDDTVADGDTRAFLDLDYTHSIGGDDTQPLTVLPINLDEEPIIGD